MAPIRQEEHMKDKLEKRSLKPSPESWEVLSNRLDSEQKKNNKSVFWWIGIAASIVGILFLTTVYFNNQPIKNDTQIIVDTKDTIINKNDDQKIEVPSTNEQLVLEEVNPSKIFSNDTEQKTKIKTGISDKNQITYKLPQEEVVAQMEKNENQSSATSSLSTPLKSGSIDKLTEINNSKRIFEEQKIQDVVAQINNLKTNGNEVTDAEIDSLLKKAQKEILSNRLYNENTRTVDANALLQDVEDDLQQSFRSKVFEALQSGYESVKTAVAERNN